MDKSDIRREKLEHIKFMIENSLSYDEKYNIYKFVGLILEKKITISRPTCSFMLSDICDKDIESIQTYFKKIQE